MDDPYGVLPSGSVMPSWIGDPVTTHERIEALAVLGKETAYKLFGIQSEDFEDIKAASKEIEATLLQLNVEKTEVPESKRPTRKKGWTERVVEIDDVSSDETENIIPTEYIEGTWVVPTGSSYKRQERLRHFLKIIRKEIMCDPANYNLDKTISCCFGELFWLFDAKRVEFSRQRHNFLSYGYFINRILELHDRLELKDRLQIAEPKLQRVIRDNARLWQVYLDHVRISDQGYRV